MNRSSDEHAGKHDIWGTIFYHCEGYDDDDDDFDEDVDQGSGFRDKSRGRSVLKRLRANKKIPYPALRSGTVMQLLNTLTICCIFFGMVCNLPINLDSRARK